MGLAAVQN